MCVVPRWVLSQTSVQPSSWLSCQGSADKQTPAPIGSSTVSIARIGSIVLAQFWETMRFLAQFWDERNYEILGRSAGETECLAVDCCSGLRQPQHRLSSTYLPSHFLASLGGQRLEPKPICSFPRILRGTQLPLRIDSYHRQACGLYHICFIICSTTLESRFLLITKVWPLL